MPEQIGGVLDNKEPEAETVRPTFVIPLKRPEDYRQRAGADADTGVAHLDTQLRAESAAPPGLNLADYR